MTAEPLRVLLVDDDEDEFVLTRALLSEIPGTELELEWIPSYGEALVALCNNRHDAGLVDYRLGPSTGLDLIREAIEGGCEAPLILLTGQGDHDVDREAMRIGAADYLDKSDLGPALLERSIRHSVERKHSLDELRASEERYALAALGANEGVWDWDLRSDEVYYSPRWKAMLGFTEDQIGLGPQEWFSRVHIEDRKHVTREVEDHVSGKSPTFQSEYRLRHRDGTYIWMQSRGLVLRDSQGTAQRLCGAQTDISLRKREEERLLQVALYDALTGVWNRAHLMELLDSTVHSANRYGQSLCLCMCDLDEFKSVNDRYGHRMGDDVLAFFGRLLRQELRKEDFVGRYGGDEFCIIFPHISSGEAAICIERIREKVSEHEFVASDGARFRVTATFGLADFARNVMTMPELLDAADKALYRAKAEGRNRVVVESG